MSYANNGPVIVVRLGELLRRGERAAAANEPYSITRLPAGPDLDPETETAIEAAAELAESEQS